MFFTLIVSFTNLTVRLRWQTSIPIWSQATQAVASSLFLLIGTMIESVKWNSSKTLK